MSAVFANNQQTLEILFDESVVDFPYPIRGFCDFGFAVTEGDDVHCFGFADDEVFVPIEGHQQVFVDGLHDVGFALKSNAFGSLFWIVEVLLEFLEEETNRTSAT